MGDSPDLLQLGLFSDADFAGHRADVRSTSGVFLALYGDHSFFLLSGQSKKQTAVSHSTREAYIAAADHAIRSSGLPALQQWERLHRRLPGQPGHRQDNDNWQGSDATTHEDNS